MFYIILALSAVWTFYVLFCLVRGSKMETQTDYTKSIYWDLSGFCFAAIVYLTCGLSKITAAVMIELILITFLYSSIPSGYNREGIFLRGMFIPFKKIQNMKGKYLKGKYRLHFVAAYRRYYLEVKDENDRVLKNCEQYYKKESVKQ